MKIKKEILKGELDLPGAAISDILAEHTRWSVHHEIIFEYQSKFYRTWYSVGATEQQDESPWEYDDEIECIEVVKVIKPMEVWDEVKS